jgi:hypothetical protein
MATIANPCRTKGILLSLFAVGGLSSHFLIALKSAQAADISPVNGYHLRQLSEKLGPLEAFIWGDFSRYNNNSNATSYIINAKTSEVTILNHKRKEYWVTPYQQFSPALSYLNKMARFNDYMELKPIGSRSGNLLSFPTKILKLENPQKFKGTALTKTEKLTVVSAELVGCPSLGQDKNMVLPVSRFLSIPAGHDFPLEFTYTNRKGGVHKILKTAVAEKVKLRPDNFKAPADYKQAKNQNEVYLDSAGHDTLEDMLR